MTCDGLNPWEQMGEGAAGGSDPFMPYILHNDVPNLLAIGSQDHISVISPHLQYSIGVVI